MLKTLREPQHISGTRYLWFDIHGDKSGGGWIDMDEWTALQYGLQDVPRIRPYIGGPLRFRFLEVESVA
ncbi:MAG: hypothetical protein M3Y57_08715 [Acidobacteriota bacterium]|nr:hypothetical protein [Acidobacteriota bacterium]